MVNDKGVPAVSGTSSGPTAKKSAAILVVEDDVDSRDMLVELIRSLGYGATGVASARELFELACERWSIALVDLDLPEVDGYEIARRLRNDPARREKRLIALTGYSDGFAREAAREAGFEEFLVKPILPEQLMLLLEPKET